MNRTELTCLVFDELTNGQAELVAKVVRQPPLCLLVS